MLSPLNIQEGIKNKNIEISRAINLLIFLVENSKNLVTRQKSLKMILSLKFKQPCIYNKIENLLISDENAEIRYLAAQIIFKKFRQKALLPFIWAIQHESNKTCLEFINRNIFRVINSGRRKVLIGEIKKIKNDRYKHSLNNLLDENNIQNFSRNYLKNVLINFFTIQSLSKKFSNIEYQIKDGIITELDFSKITKKVISWHDREDLQDFTEIKRINNLKSLKVIKLFSLKWAIQNEISFKCLIALVKTIAKMNNYLSKNTIQNYLNEVGDYEFYPSNINYNHSHDKINENFNSKLTNTLINFLTITYFKNKFPNLIYRVKNGEIIELTINQTPIITISSEIKHLKSLRSLILKYCKIYAIPEEISSLKCLEVLNLEGNNLKTIPKSLNSLKSLKFLNLSRNQINQIPFFLNSLPSLKILLLEENRLTKFPFHDKNKVLLKYLNLSKNQIKKIPKSMEFLPSLRHLDLSQNHIENFFNSIHEQNSLIYLNLSDNKLQYIPESIGLLIRLKSLNLEGNLIQSIPESIKNLKRLQKLKIGKNKIKDLPHSIKSLSMLKFLDLENNNLDDIPSQVYSISSLKYLNLSRNSIKRIPNHIKKLKSLEILDLFGNKIIIFPNSIKSLLSLEYLNLQDNMLVEKPDLSIFTSKLKIYI